MRYILTGGSGFIGSHFSQKLGNSIIYNYDIISPNENSKNFKCINILNKRKLLSQTIKNCNDVALIHLAAVHFDFQKQYFETNVQGTKNVLEYVRKNNIKIFVFFSSVAIYGNSVKGKDENSTKNPINDYGKSKLKAEKIIKEWSKKNPGCRIIIIRPAVVFGENNFGNVYNLISQIKSRFYVIIGKGDNIKSIAYVKNVVDSVLFSIDNVKNKYFVYNYCDYPQITIELLSHKVCDILKIKYPIKIPLIISTLITLPVDFFEKILNRDLKFNSKRIKKFTNSTFFISDRIRNKGFLPNYNLNSSIKNTLDWISKNNVKELRSIWYSRAKKL